MAVRDWSTSAASNTSVGGVTIAEGATARANINDMGRAIMADIATEYQLYVVNPERYGAVGDGVTDDTTAWTSALAAGRPVVCAPGRRYKITAALTISLSTVVNLNGSTIVLSGAAGRAFVRNGATAAASTTVSSGATLGSLSVVVASATGLAVGQWVRFSSSDAGHDPNSYPPGWAKITSIAGTTIGIDRPLPVTYAATVTLTAFAATSFLERFWLANGTVDGSATSYNADTGQAVRMAAVADVCISDVHFLNFTANASNTSAVQIFDCIAATMTGCRSIGGVSSTNMVDIQNCATAVYCGNTVDGSHFGTNLSRIDAVQASGNVFVGRRRAEQAGAAAGTSIRGLKLYGCGHVSVGRFAATDYESAVKIEACFRYEIDGAAIWNCGGDQYTIAFNVGSQILGSNMAGGIINAVNIENVQGAGIGVTSDSDGRVVISNCVIKDTGSYGIYAPVRDVHVSNCIVQNWNQINGSYTGVHAGEGGCVTGVTFRNTDATDVCLQAPGTTGRLHVVDHIRRPDSNPLYSSSRLAESSGVATIASGSTSVTVTHNLIVAPAASDIVLTPTENPTADAGSLYITGITSTQFVINCRTDPGASALDIAWKATLKMPFTS